MAEGKTYWTPAGLQPALDQLAGAAGDAARAAGATGAARASDPVSDIPMMAASPTRPWWKPVLVIAGSLALGWAGWRLWTTGDPRALLPWPRGAASFGGGPFGGGPFGGAAALPGPNYGDDCGCGG